MIGRFFRSLFSPMGFLIIIYVFIGIFENTAPPHFPANNGSLGTEVHNWIQYIVSVLGWPLSFFNPPITFTKWLGP